VKHSTRENTKIERNTF